MDQERLTERGKGRVAAETLITLITEEMVRISGSREALIAFQESLEEHFAPKAKRPLVVMPMDAREVAQFSQEIMPFGKFKGQAISDIDLQYLDWLVGESESFMAQLRRYMLSEKVAEELRTSLTTQDREDLH